MDQPFYANFVKYSILKLTYNNKSTFHQNYRQISNLTSSIQSEKGVIEILRV